MFRGRGESGRIHPFLLVVAAVLALALVFTFFQFESRQPRPAANGNAYVDQDLCADCHGDVAKTYRETGMGRSFSRLTPETAFEDFTQSAFYHEASRQYLRTYKKAGKFFQRRHQTGPDGTEMSVVEKEIHYVVGSGNHVRTYLHRTGNGRLLQLPAAWYRENGGSWAMNPGFDQPRNPGIRRFLSQDCFFCHNGYPANALTAGRVGADLRVAEPVPAGIDCQRCHGPGAAHIEAVSTGPSEKIRAAIINPARLDKKRQLEICLQCHLESTSRRLPYALVRFNRNTFSFRPGEPLEDYILHFDYAPGQGPQDHFEIAHHAYRLMKSECFRESQGNLLCTTCHDPHRAYRGEEAVAKFSAACAQCHSASDLTALIEAGTHPRQTEGCVTCHMPKRRTDDVVRVVMTDHLIQRRPPPRDLLAPLQEIVDTEETAYRGEVVLLYPPSLEPSPQKELYLAAAQVVERSNVTAGAPRLQAAIERIRPKEARFYHTMAESWWRLRDTEKAIHWYRQALKQDADYLPSIRNLGVALSRAGRPAEARAFLAEARKKVPDDPALLNNLGEASLLVNDLAAAEEALRSALKIDPELPEALANQGRLYEKRGQMDQAERSFREALRIAPDNLVARNNLADLLIARDRFEEAVWHFEEAIRLDPASATTHLNYGLALAGRQQFAEAERYFAKAAALDDSLSDAHASLGNLLAMRGETVGARRSFERALEIDPRSGLALFNYGLMLTLQGNASDAKRRLGQAIQADPDLAEAHLALAQILLQEGQVPEAVPHLQAVAQSRKSQLRLAAQDMLKKIGH